MSNPTTKVAAFNGTLDGFTGVDPIRYSNGLWLEEDGRNMVRNPSAETDASAITAASSTVTRITSEHQVGAAAFNVVTNGGANNQGIVFLSNTGLNRVNVSQQFPSRVWLKGSGTVNVWVRIANSDATNTDGATTLVTLTSSWQEVTPAIPTSNNAKTVDSVQLHVRTNVTQVITFQVDAGMILDNKAYLLSYLDGSLGSGYAWEGTANLSASTRAASSASLSPSGILSPSNGAIAMRVTPTIETGVEEIWFECGVKGSGTDHFQGGRDASKHPFIEWSSNNASYQRLTASETWNALAGKTLYLGWNGTSAYLQVDSGTLQSASRDAVSASWGAGNIKLQASKGGNIITPFSAYSEHLNDTDRALVIASIAAGGSNLATVLDDAAAPLRTLNIRTNALLRQ